MQGLKRIIKRTNKALVVYLVSSVLFICCTAYYVRQTVLYWNIKEWPTTELIDIKNRKFMGEIFSASAYGPSGYHLIENNYLAYSYEVDGVLYEGSVGRPDGEEPRPDHEDGWRVYYNPSAPEVSALNVSRYQNLGLLALIASVGILLAAMSAWHIYYFALKTAIRSKRRT